VFLTGGLGFYIQPGTHQTYSYSCSPTVPSRILFLANHMHAHALRMSAWVVPNGNAASKKQVLEAYSWEDPSNIFYDTAHTNTPADPTTKTAGSDVSGDLVVNPTDSIQWECEVNNDSDKVLTFRNEVFTGEMCILTGSMVRADDPMQTADFRCTLN
jgi:hypothetical protein